MAVCRCLISARIEMRSAASRLDNGSSIRNTAGWRTIARPSATRWRCPPESWLGRRLQQMRDFELGGGVAHPAVDLGAGDFAHAQAEGDVLVDRFVRIERVALEHHRDVALVRRQRVDDLVVEPQFALGDLLEPRDHVQRRRLAAAGRAEQDDELLVADLEVEIVDGNDVAGSAWSPS